MDTTKSSYMVPASLKQLHNDFVHNCLEKRISASLPETIERNITCDFCCRGTGTTTLAFRIKLGNITEVN